MYELMLKNGDRAGFPKVQFQEPHWAVELAIVGSVLQAGESSGFVPAETGKSQKEYNLK